MPTDDALRDYLTRDPLGLGFDWSADNDTAVAGILNDPARGGVVSLAVADRARVAEAILADETLIEKYTTVLPFLAYAEFVPAAKFAEDMPDVFSRPGSPAEAAWGVGTHITPSDVSRCVPKDVSVSRSARAQKQDDDFRVGALASLIATARAAVNEGDISALPWLGEPRVLTDKQIAEAALTELKRTGG